MNYPILRLKTKRERSILLRHPWIFSGAVEESPKADDGEIIQINSFTGDVLGYGFFSNKSQIVCRMFEWGVQSRDFLGVDYWYNKLGQAFEVRKRTINFDTTNAYRLVHAEGDFFPGIIIDIYNEVAVIQILTKGVERIKSQITEALNKLGFKNLFARTKNSSHIMENIGESEWLSGSSNSPVLIKEHNVSFHVDFLGGQKTGFFLDQRENRAMIGDFCKDKTVLNAFSFTGGFSVYALAAGAKEVHSLDISKDAVAGALENATLNNVKGIHEGITEDCFDYLKKMPADLYDVIILDPPAFAKHARAVGNASRGYKEINMKAFQKVKKGGLVFTFSCSQNISKELFQKIIFGAAADAKKNVRIIKQFHQPDDHPINIFHPEGEYLKGLALYVE
ncbi:MAG TPA: class I SAM-dependent rRNA methyltransferase [Cytophagaceae bacterium]|jgi:23S rRNA (cytosine1962-C5)-methyltransferase